MLSYLGLAAIVVGSVVAVAIAVVGGQLMFGFGEQPRCSRCGATLADEGEDCTVCQTPFEDPGGTEPGDVEAERTIQTEEQSPEIDSEVGALNPGVSKRMVRWALIAMFTGLGVRLLAMLEPVGLDVGVSDQIVATLTVIGGVGMFLGFIVLDFA